MIQRKKKNKKCSTYSLQGNETRPGDILLSFVSVPHATTESFHCKEPPVWSKTITGYLSGRKKMHRVSLC